MELRTGIADGGGHEAIHSAAALKQKAPVPFFWQAQLKTRAVMFAVRAGARADLAFHYAVRLRLLDRGGVARQGRHGIGANAAA